MFGLVTFQIVPFLSLGLGIDDMFLLLHNYDELYHTVHHNEMGILLKETGMSIMVTSINNILAFVSGYVLPIPALRSFCSQVHKNWALISVDGCVTTLQSAIPHVHLPSLHSA